MSISRMLHVGKFSNITDIACLLGWELAVEKSWHAGNMAHH